MPDAFVTFVREVEEVTPLAGFATIIWIVVKSLFVRAGLPVRPKEIVLGALAWFLMEYSTQVVYAANAAQGSVSLIDTIYVLSAIALYCTSLLFALIVAIEILAHANLLSSLIGGFVGGLASNILYDLAKAYVNAIWKMYKEFIGVLFNKKNR